MTARNELTWIDFIWWAQTDLAVLNKPALADGNTATGDRTKAAIAEQRKFSALLKMLRAGLT